MPSLPLVPCEADTRLSRDRNPRRRLTFRAAAGDRRLARGAWRGRMRSPATSSKPQHAHAKRLGAVAVAEAASDSPCSAAERELVRMHSLLGRRRQRDLRHMRTASGRVDACARQEFSDGEKLNPRMLTPRALIEARARGSHMRRTSRSICAASAGVGLSVRSAARAQSTAFCLTHAGNSGLG
jgi:hypothetical protein